jgi:hypothetical protein
MYAACMAVRVSIDMGIQMHTLSVVNSGPFYTFIPCKDFINTNRNNLFRRSKRQRDFSLFLVLHELHIPTCPPVLPLAHPREFNMEIHV